MFKICKKPHRWCSSCVRSFPSNLKGIDWIFIRFLVDGSFPLRSHLPPTGYHSSLEWCLVLFPFWSQWLLIFREPANDSSCFKRKRKIRHHLFCFEYRKDTYDPVSTIFKICRRPVTSNIQMQHSIISCISRMRSPLSFFKSTGIRTSIKLSRTLVTQKSILSKGSRCFCLCVLPSSKYKAWSLRRKNRSRGL